MFKLTKIIIAAVSAGAVYGLYQFIAKLVSSQIMAATASLF